MGCATGIVKYLVFLANLVFALAGLALVIIGILYKVNSDATKVLPSDFGLAPILSIIIGAIVFITAFLGCCGAVKESPCMLTTYAIILLAIFIIQLAIGVYAFIKIKDPNQFRSAIHKTFSETFNNRLINTEANETVILTQRWLQCCGIDSDSDWNTQNLPASCCQNNASPCSPASPQLHRRGCVDAMFETLKMSSQVVGSVTIAIAAVEIIGAIFGLCLSSSIRNHYRRNIYA